MASTHRRNAVEFLGAKLLGGLRWAGGLSLLGRETLRWAGRGVVHRRARLRRGTLSAQMVRVGVRSLGVVFVVQSFIGAILALQMAAPLAQWGQESQIPRIVGAAGFRMLGPIITAVVLSGFAGASIAAELGTMVVAEEVEALEVMALNPVRFLVLPRVLATFIMMILLTVIADLILAFGGYAAAWAALGPDVYRGYWDRMRDQLAYMDFFTGLIQGGVFGLLIGLIACFEGLGVRGGAQGVGRATTLTVVYSIVAIGAAALVCTMIFYAFGL
ncbi:MAG: ABC transporter permease [Phycisphaerae bacterium]|nr:ABC transporter permease [Phycisphaerae bacterium]